MRPLPSLVIVSIVITVLSAAGCQQEAAPPPGPVARVIQQHCSQCHTAGGIAPYPFDTHEQTAALAEAIKTAVVSRTMPPMNAANDGSCHTFQDARWLTDEEVATIAAWADAGAPPEGWLPPLKAEPPDIVTASSVTSASKPIS